MNYLSNKIWVPGLKEGREDEKFFKLEIFRLAKRYYSKIEYNEKFSQVEYDKLYNSLDADTLKTLRMAASIVYNEFFLTDDMQPKWQKNHD